MENISNHLGAFFQNLQPCAFRKYYRHKTPRESKVINIIEGFVWASLILDDTAQVQKSSHYSTVRILTNSDLAHHSIPAAREKT